jgi:hypothetical protein
MILGFAAVGFIAYRRKPAAATAGAFVMPFAAAAAALRQRRQEM